MAPSFSLATIDTLSTRSRPKSGKLIRLKNSLNSLNGTYTQFQDWKENQKQYLNQQNLITDTISKEIPNKTRRIKTNSERERLRIVQVLEQNIQTLEQEKSQILAELNGSNINPDRIIALTTRFNELNNQISPLFEKWTELADDGQE